MQKTREGPSSLNAHADTLTMGMKKPYGYTKLIYPNLQWSFCGEIKVNFTRYGYQLTLIFPNAVPSVTEFQSGMIRKPRTEVCPSPCPSLLFIPCPCSTLVHISGLYVYDLPGYRQSVRCP